jgi:hypothetical protein
MDVKVGGGACWGIPISGGFVNLSNADISQILQTASGLAKGLVYVGALGLAVKIIGSFLGLDRKKDRIPITSMAHIQTYSSIFSGVCITDVLSYRTGNENLDVPMSFIKDINIKKEEVELVNGDWSCGCSIRNQNLLFLSLSGVREINIRDIQHIEGCSTEDVLSLRHNLTFALEHNAHYIVDTLGQDAFLHFFLHKQSRFPQIESQR